MNPIRRIVRGLVFVALLSLLVFFYIGVQGAIANSALILHV